MTSRRLKWVPGLLFLAIQFINTIYELSQDTRTMSWAPHTMQAKYEVHAFGGGLRWNKSTIESRYGIAENAWEVHGTGNLSRLIESVEAQQSSHPDSVHIIYSRNGGILERYRWIANDK